MEDLESTMKKTKQDFYKYCKIKILFTFQCGKSNVPINKSDFFKYIHFFYKLDSAVSSHKIPAVQRCPHCIFLMFSSFSTRLPETPVSIIGNIHLVSLKSQKLTHTIVLDLDIYPKSGNLLLGFPPLEGSLNSSVMKQ